ncbi:MAG: glycosyltransferase family 4 protein, partial [Terriglobales bacterium]
MLLDLASEQSRLGHDVTICVLGGPGLLDQRTRELGLPLVHLHAPPGLWTRVGLLSKFLRAHQFDIVHSHWGVWLPAAISARLNGIRFVHTHHSNQRHRY